MKVKMASVERKGGSKLQPIPMLILEYNVGYQSSTRLSIVSRRNI